jgi:hypothetical protein
MRPAIGERFLAVGKMQSVGKMSMDRDWQHGDLYPQKRHAKWQTTICQFFVGVRKPVNSTSLTSYLFHLYLTKTLINSMSKYKLQACQSILHLKSMLLMTH